MRFWKDEYQLRAKDFDKYNNIKPSAVLDLFQDAACRHAEELGVGFDAMLARSYLWVLTRINFKIVSAPEKYQRVTVKTWPLAPNRFLYRREYCIENENGEPLIKGSSEWAVIDCEKRRLVADPHLYSFYEGFCTEVMLEDKLARVRNFDHDGNGYEIRAGFCELDANDHVNNTEYADYVMNAVVPDEGEMLDVFKIDYRKELLAGERLHVFCEKGENEVLAKGINDNGEVVFACEYSFTRRQ